MVRSLYLLPSLVLLVLAGCEAGAVVEDDLGVDAFAVRVCADGPTVEGIDVSKWQGTIDWDAVATSSVEFAIVRVSDGLGYPDARFAFNWSEARRVGLVRGVYQYFRPGQDPIEQANLLLDAMGPLQPGDLPPVLDVEAADGQSAAVIVERIHAWVNHVEQATGVRPMIYTAKYFWQDQVGAPADFLDLPLWVANYGVECPLIADPWPRWDFWQYTSTGSVPGIAGNVDRNVFNGTTDELLAFGYVPVVCGDGVCEGDEDEASCAADCAPPVEAQCGDGVCEGDEDEATCAVDCAPPVEAQCGDGVCEGDEDAATCAVDCGGDGGDGDGGDGGGDGDGNGDAGDEELVVSGGCAVGSGGGDATTPIWLMVALAVAWARRRGRR